MGAGGGGSDAFLAVVTASADGSVRLWNGQTAKPVCENHPVNTHLGECDDTRQGFHRDFEEHTRRGAFAFSDEYDDRGYAGG